MESRAFLSVYSSICGIGIVKGKVIFIVIVLCFMTIVYHMKTYPTISYDGHHYVPQKEARITRRYDNDKTILLWNSFWDAPFWEVGPDQQAFTNLNCKAKNCNITMDRNKINISSAVLFHIEELGGIPPALGNPLQKRVFFMLESPGHSKAILYRSPIWRSAFHWTMTYAMDSTIPIPYGRITKKEKALQVIQRPTNQTDNRKLVAVMSRNCDPPSKRRQYIAELSKHIAVDHYGECGNLHCKKNIANDDDICLKMLNTKYKFYLAFENSFCRDYVTEKFFKILPLNMVPIIRGGADYSKLGGLKWYIDTKDFESPKALAKYLLHLNENPIEYNRYLENRNMFELNVFYGLRKLQGWCDLCELVNNEGAMDKQETIDVAKWWDKDKDCVLPNDI